MLKNKLLQKDNNIVRVLETENDKALVVNCIKRVVPQWINTAELTEYTECSINDLSDITGICTLPIDKLDNESRCIAYKRFTASPVYCRLLQMINPVAMLLEIWHSISISVNKR